MDEALVVACWCDKTIKKNVTLLNVKKIIENKQQTFIKQQRQTIISCRSRFHGRLDKRVRLFTEWEGQIETT